MSDVNFKKNRKPLSNYILLPLFLFVLGSLCALILALTNELTADKIKQNEVLVKEQQLSSIKSALEEQEMVDIETVNCELVSGRDASHLAYEVMAVLSCKKDDNSFYAFEVSHTNSYTDVISLVVINADNNKVVFVKVINNATTLGAAKNNAFFDKDNWFKSEEVDLNNYSSEFDVIAGATFSSKSVKSAVKYAYAQIDMMKGGTNNE